MSDNMLFCSAGRRARLLMDAKESFGNHGTIVATDNNPTAPALYCADRRYTVPLISAPDYMDHVFDICDENHVKAITTLIDPGIAILSDNFEEFERRGILPLCPNKETARYCFNKWELYKYLIQKGIRTPLTFHSLDEFKKALSDGRITLPVFMKPVCGSGSVGAHRVDTLEQVEADWHSGEHDYIIQELMTQGDCDADVYVDCISHKPVAAFSKRKIETRIGGASKTISYKDAKLFSFIEDICAVMDFNGPLDMDFFIKDGEYYLSEVNPRFGGAYLHAYGAGVDFFKLIRNNMNGRINDSEIGNYDDDIVMMMYDDVIIRPKSELVNDHFTTI